MLGEVASVLGGSRGLPPTLAFLFKLAWASRVRLPLLITLGFMITNTHMRLEINVNTHIHEDDAAAIETEEDDDDDSEDEGGSDDSEDYGDTNNESEPACNYNCINTRIEKDVQN